MYLSYDSRSQVPERDIRRHVTNQASRYEVQAMRTNRAPTDAELLSARDPDGRCFAIFYRRHVYAVLCALSRAGADAWQAGDVTAETFQAALIHRDQFDAARGNGRSWVLGIAQNKLADSRRADNQETRLNERLRAEAPHLTERDVADYGRIADEYGTAMRDGLSARQQRAVFDRVIAERSYADMAADMNSTEQAARQHVSRGLAVLRRRMLQKPGSSS